MVQADGVEVELSDLIVLNPAEQTLPFYPSHTELVRSFIVSCSRRDNWKADRRRMRIFGRSTDTWTFGGANYRPI